jgi:sensor histidine kinase YesM
MLTNFLATRCTFAFRNRKMQTGFMDITVIFAIIISTIVTMGIVILVVLLFYYHWRNKELLVNFSAFIRENLKLKDEINKLLDENNQLRETRNSKTK